MIKGFRTNIAIDSAVKIVKGEENWLIETERDRYQARNLVLATPPPTSIKLLQIKEANVPTSIHAFHVSGKPQNILNGFEYHFFSERPDRSDLLAVFHQIDDTFLLWSNAKEPDLDKYFSAHKIIKHKFWEHALSPKGHVLWDCELDKNLYLIGDHNECCLEDAYVTGLYAANRIIENNSNK